ncbi:NACHT domain-containing protein [candidate division KSB1 bacterium]
MNNRIAKYLSDLVYSYQELATRFTPLSFDFQSLDHGAEKVIARNSLRRGMGIIEAQRALKRFVLVGEPGSGKSTALRYLARHCATRSLEIIEEEPETPGMPDGVQVPVFIELNLYRASDEGNGILNLVYDHFYPYFFSGDFQNQIDEWIVQGKLLIILDGLNETPQRYREEAVRDIKSFLIKYQQCRFILSSRVRDYPDLFQLSILSVQPLTTQTVDSFIFRSLSDIPDHEAHAEKLKSYLSEYNPEFIFRPLLLKIVLDVFRESDWTIPRNKALLFRRFFEIWFRQENLKIRKIAPMSRLLLIFRLVGTIAYKMQNRGELRTSRENAWSLIGGFLEKQVESRRIKADEYAADAILEEFLGMGLFIEQDNRIKFYHQMFQEFFAGYHLAGEKPQDAAMRLGRVWWEEPIIFYAGIIENATPVIRAALDKNDVVSAVKLLSSCFRCDTEITLLTYKKLVGLLFDKFSRNRRAAEDYLVRIPDPAIDTILNGLLEAAEDAKTAKRYENVLQKRKSTLRHMEYKTPGMTGRPDKVTESREIYSGSVSQCMRAVERAVYEEGVESGTLLLKEAVGVLGSVTVEREVRRMIRSSLPVNSFLFVVWALKEVTEKRGVDIIIERHARGMALPLKNFVDEKRIRDPVVRVLFSILFDADVKRCWQLELAQYDLLCIDDPEREPLCTELLESMIAQRKIDPGLLEFLLQVYWDINPENAEYYILEWIERFPDRPALGILIKFLSKYGVGLLHIEKAAALMNVIPDNIRHFLPEILAKTGVQRAKSLLVNLIKNAQSSLRIRGAAISALKYCAGASDRQLLIELKDSDQKEIYDPAYEVLLEIDKRLQHDEKMYYTEHAEDMSLELLFDDEFESDIGSEPRITLDENDRRSAVINGTKIHFGPVSGRIFYFLAKNSGLGKYHTVEDIRSHLELLDLVLDDSAVRNRITDIRNRVRRSLEGRIDPGRLLENARRYGYRINADVEIV